MIVMVMVIVRVTARVIARVIVRMIVRMTPQASDYHQVLARHQEGEDAGGSGEEQNVV